MRSDAMQWKEALLVFLGSAITIGWWFVQRHLTGAKRDEQSRRITDLLELKEKLEKAGWAYQSISDLLRKRGSGSKGISDKTMSMVLDEPLAYSGPSRLDTTAAIGVQLDARLQTLDKQIDELLLKLEIVIEDEGYWDAIQKAHASWCAYRKLEGAAAFQEMIGGTGRTMNSLATELV